MIFKIIALVIIFIVCSLIGIILSYEFIRREQELKDIILMLEKLKTQIEYSHTTVKDIMLSLSNEFLKLSFLNDAYLLMCQKNSFKTAWEVAINQSNLRIKNADKNLLHKLGDIIGSYDVSTQIKEIKIIEKFLNASLEVSIQEKQKKTHLYQSLGVLGGLMLVMIIV